MVSEALEAFLKAEIEGADAVRAELARKLATQLDDTTTPPYVIARVSAELRAVIAEIDGTEAEDVAVLARRILADVA